MKSAACCAWLAAVKIARLSALSTSSNQEQIINVKEHPVPFDTQQWADGLLHIISLTAKVHRATQEHSCRASTREVCSVLMGFLAFKPFPRGLHIACASVLGVWQRQPVHLSPIVNTTAEKSRSATPCSAASSG